MSPAVRGDSLYGRRSLAGHTAFPDKSRTHVAVALTDIRFVEVEDANDGATIAIVVGLGLALWWTLSALAFGKEMIEFIR